MLTHASTVQRSSMRLLLCPCAMDDNLKLLTRDVSHAYVQSDTTDQRSIVVRPPSVLVLPIETLLRVESPLHGLSEAGVHWFRTYHSHQKDFLSLEPSTLDKCFLYTSEEFSDDFDTRGVPRGFSCLQTDDTANAGDFLFIKKEAFAFQKFDCKDPIFLSNDNSILFDGAEITRLNGMCLLTQSSRVLRLSIVQTDRVDSTAFISERARSAYIADI